MFCSVNKEVKVIYDYIDHMQELLLLGLIAFQYAGK